MPNAPKANPKSNAAANLRITTDSPDPTPNVRLQPPRAADPAPKQGASRRDGVIDRRLGLDRRVVDAMFLDEPPAQGGKPGDGAADRRRGPGRRLSDFTKAAEEGNLTKEQFMFLMAIDEFKKANSKHYPTWTDVLEVVRLLGYRKTMASEMKFNRAEDWRESPNAPSDVRPERWAERAA